MNSRRVLRRASHEGRRVIALLRVLAVAARPSCSRARASALVNPSILTPAGGAVLARRSQDVHLLDAG